MTKARPHIDHTAELAGTLLALALLALLALAPAARATPGPFSIRFGEDGTGAGQTGFARGLAADPAGGHLFVADQSNGRIDEFTAWGTFVRAFGFGVRDGAAEFQVCTEETGCQVGIESSAADGPGGWKGSPEGVALDSAGNLYVTESRCQSCSEGTADRIQKFDLSGPDPAFAWMAGAEVNKTAVALREHQEAESEPVTVTEAEENLCTAASGDECGAGVPGAGPGEFAASPDSPAATSLIAVDPEGHVYVGDDERIERFGTGGEYQGEIALPGESVHSLAAAPSGDLWAVYQESGNTPKANVHKLSPSGEELASVSVLRPVALATDPAGNLYVFDEVQPNHGSGDPCNGEVPIRKFTPAGAEVSDSEYPFEDCLRSSTGLAANVVDEEGGIDIYVANSVTNESYLRAYGAIPDPATVGPPPALAPSIEGQFASEVGVSTASLVAKLNPHYWQDATFQAEYATAACIEGSGWEAPCVSRVPGSPRALVAGVVNTAVRRSVTLEGLSAGTDYRFRFVAQSSGGGPVAGPEASFLTYRRPETDSACPNRAYRNGPSAALPDCRAYEMVSPVDKNGGDIVDYFLEGFDADTAFTGFDQASASGSKIAYSAPIAFAGALGAPILSHYLATRTPAGWTTESLDPPLRGGAGKAESLASQYHAFSADLTTGWLAPQSGLPLSPGPTPGYRNLYRRDIAAGTYTWLESSAPEPEPCEEPETVICTAEDLWPELQGVSADATHALFRVNDLLTPDAVPELHTGTGGQAASQLYLWSEGGAVRLVSVLPDGTPYPGESTAGSELDSTAPWLEGVKGTPNSVTNALSRDGRTVYWSSPNSSHLGPDPNRLYVRVNAEEPQSAVSGGHCTEAAKACTLPVSGAIPTGQPARFWTASPDGSKAIFSIAGSSVLAGNLYEYDLAEGKATKIAGKTAGVAGWSEDASRIYLASEEACGAGPNSEGDVAEPGALNLYLYEAGESCGEFAFVGALAAADRSRDNNAGGPPSPLALIPRDRAARATPDGRALAFVSAAPLTGYDNADADSGEADREVYLYRAASGELACASCNPSGARPQGADLVRNTSAIAGIWTAAWLPGYQQELYPRRPLSEDGNRLFFNSVEPLAVRDTNGAQDVYQWEVPGTGECTASSSTYSPQNKGCVSLISTGQSPEDSEFVDASESGDDVFIRTASNIDPRDPGLVDIYDARAGGGFPPPAAASPCEGDSCQSPPPAPRQATPASAAFRGKGNLAAPARSCRGPARGAHRLSRRARRLRGAAKRLARSGAGGRARGLRRRAARDAHRARRLAKSARRCRAKRKRAGHDRRGRR